MATTNDASSERWISEQLHAAGLSTGADAYKFVRFIPWHVGLTVEGQPIPSVVARFYSGQTESGGLNAPLAFAVTGSKRERELAREGRHRLGLRQQRVRSAAGAGHLARHRDRHADQRI